MAKEGNTEIWTLENKNVCFRYEHRKFRQDIWHIIIPLIICVTLMLIEFFVWKTFASVLPCVIFLGIMTLNWLAHTTKKNENTEEEIIRNILFDKIKSWNIKYNIMNLKEKHLCIMKYL